MLSFTKRESEHGNSVINQKAGDHANQVTAREIGTVNNGNTYNINLQIEKENAQQAPFIAEGKKEDRDIIWREVRPGEDFYKIACDEAPLDVLRVYKTDDFIIDDGRGTRYMLLVQTQDAGRIHGIDSDGEEMNSFTPSKKYFDKLLLTVKTSSSKILEREPLAHEVDEGKVSNQVKTKLETLFDSIETKGGSKL